MAGGSSIQSHLNGGPAPYTYTYTYIHTHTWTSRCHTLGLQVAQRIVWAPLGRGSADPDPCGAHRSKGLKSFARLDLAGQGDGVVEAVVAHEVHVDRVLEKLVPVKGNHAFGFAWEAHLQAKTLKEEPVDEHDSA